MTDSLRVSILTILLLAKYALVNDLRPLRRRSTALYWKYLQKKYASVKARFNELTISDVYYLLLTRTADLFNYRLDLLQTNSIDISLISIG